MTRRFNKAEGGGRWDRRGATVGKLVNGSLLTSSAMRLTHTQTHRHTDKDTKTKTHTHTHTHTDKDKDTKTKTHRHVCSLTKPYNKVLV